jgi:hypothetical protein
MMKHNNVILYQSIQFIVMIIIAILLNPMNVLLYQIDHYYISLTLIYSGIFMASNMIWAHEVVYYIYAKKINLTIFSIGILLAILSGILLLRKQFLVDDKQWLMRMISHHSSAITTSKNIRQKTTNNKIKKLADDIIDTQLKEIYQMKEYLNDMNH